MYWEAITILTYMHSKTEKIFQEKLTNSKLKNRQFNNNKYFNMPLSIIDRCNRHNIKDIENLNETVNQLDLTDICSTLHPTKIIHSSQAHLELSPG